MGSHNTHNQTPATADQAGAADQRRTVGRDRRAVRTVDLTDEDIAAIEASAMAPGFEYLNAELEPEATSLVEEGVRFARDLGQRGEKSEARLAHKAFRDGLYDDD